MSKSPSRLGIAPSIRQASEALGQSATSVLHFTSLLTITIYGIVQARDALVPICLAALIACLLAPGVRLLRKRGVPEWLAVLLVVAAFILPMVALIYEVTVQAEALFRDFPRILAGVQEKMTELESTVFNERFHFSQEINAASLTARIESELGTSLGIAVQGLKTFLSAGGHVTLVLVFAVVMLVSRAKLLRSCKQIILIQGSPSMREDPKHFLGLISELIERFLTVRLGIALGVALVNFVVLCIFGINYTLAVAIFMGFMTLVPAIGSIIGLIPPIILSFSQGYSGGKTTALVAAFLVVSGIEGHILSPKLLGRHLNLNLLFTFLGFFVGERIWGAWGMFLSIPVVGIIRIFLHADPSLRVWGNLISEIEEPTV